MSEKQDKISWTTVGRTGSVLFCALWLDDFLVWYLENIYNRDKRKKRRGVWGTLT